MLSHNEKYGGWCICSKEKIAEELDLSRRTVFGAIKTLEAKSLIKKSEKGFLRTTDEWNELIANKHDYLIAFNGKEQSFISGKLQQKAMNSPDSAKIALPMQKLHPTVQNLHSDSAEIAPYIYKIPTIDTTTTGKIKKILKLPDTFPLEEIENVLTKYPNKDLENVAIKVAGKYIGRGGSDLWTIFVNWAATEKENKKEKVELTPQELHKKYSKL